jgi:hypothetical protein
MQTSTKEQTKGKKEGRQKERKKERKAYFCYGMTDDIVVHVDTTKNVMACW